MNVLIVVDVCYLQGVPLEVEKVSKRFQHDHYDVKSHFSILLVATADGRECRSEIGLPNQRYNRFYL